MSDVDLEQTTRKNVIVPQVPPPLTSFNTADILRHARFYFGFEKIYDPAVEAKKKQKKRQKNKIFTSANTTVSAKDLLELGLELIETYAETAVNSQLKNSGELNLIVKAGPEETQVSQSREPLRRGLLETVRWFLHRPVPAVSSGGLAPGVAVPVHLLDADPAFLLSLWSSSQSSSTSSSPISSSSASSSLGLSLAYFADRPRRHCCQFCYFGPVAMWSCNHSCRVSLCPTCRFATTDFDLCTSNKAITAGLSKTFLQPPEVLKCNCDELDAAQALLPIVVSCSTCPTKTTTTLTASNSL